ncbi:MULTISPECIES: hypothetical protein [unclassified Methylosinus]|uniref:hypothetical protein n=1 Tax=unclassified Methylosinus TaxID=2624500 RepID=UPI0007C96FD1|nr:MULTISPECIES: hypothetical protein [unclassified Methylosinus]
MLESILFDPDMELYRFYPDLDKLLTECTREAENSMRMLSQFSMKAKFSVFPPIEFGSFGSNNWSIVPIGKKFVEIRLVLDAFDQVDCEYVFALRSKILMDSLSVWTNCAFYQTGIESGVPHVDDLCRNIFFDQIDWLEDHPIMSGKLCLSTDQLSYGNSIVAGSIGQGERLARAAQLFHEARIMLLSAPHLHNDTAAALLISALEVVSLIDEPPKNCASCGQPIYKISRRVADLGVRHLGAGAKWIFDRHYKRRSSYLHRGVPHAAQPYTGSAIPQLDPQGIEGCALPTPVGAPMNLMEFTSCIIRAEMRSEVAARSLAAP